MSLVEGLIKVLVPHECLCCQSEGGLLCSDCANGFEKLPPRCYKCRKWNKDYLTCQRCRAKTPLYGVMAVAPYEGLAKDLVHALKFERAKAGADTIARLLAEVCTPNEDVVITHIPTAPSRVRQRGFDQAALIARILARRLEFPYLPLLDRMGAERQLGQSRDIRVRQMKDAFRATGAVDLRNRHVLLVDDVLTTGATAEAAARILRMAGAKRVSAAVFAVA